MQNRFALSIVLRPALRFVLGPVAMVYLLLVGGIVFGAICAPTPARAADRARIEAFLSVTGFDVALDSIALSAADAPQMLGIEAEAFGSEWHRLTGKVFDTSVMRDLAVNILEQTLSDEALNHAAAFYASDLGQRLVAAENTVHMMEDSEAKTAEGSQIIADLVSEGAPRLEVLKRMNLAVDSAGFSVRALQEIQTRFLLAASAAGVIELRLDADELRALMKSQEGEMRLSIQKTALTGAAFTYRAFSDADVEAYTEALETPLMKEVYELLNAVQYEVMANRFELLAARMADLHPGQDI